MSGISCERFDAMVKQQQPHLEVLQATTNKMKKLLNTTVTTM